MRKRPDRTSWAGGSQAVQQHPGVGNRPATTSQRVIPGRSSQRQAKGHRSHTAPERGPPAFSSPPSGMFRDPYAEMPTSPRCHKAPALLHSRVPRAPLSSPLLFYSFPFPSLLSRHCVPGGAVCWGYTHAWSTDTTEGERDGPEVTAQRARAVTGLPSGFWEDREGAPPGAGTVQVTPRCVGGNKTEVLMGQL